MLDDDLVIAEYDVGVHVVAGASGASTALAVRDAVGVATGHGQIYVKTTVPTIVAGTPTCTLGSCPAIPDFLATMAAGRDAVFICIATTLVAIDPSIDTAAETATVTGQFTCPDCTSSAVKVRIGDATVDVDGRGAFTARVTGRGWLEARYQTSAGAGWSPGTPPLVVELSGKRSYQLAPLVGSDDTLGD